MLKEKGMTEVDEGEFIVRRMREVKSLPKVLGLEDGLDTAVKTKHRAKDIAENSSTPKIGEVKRTSGSE
jgi:hypothetical protein